MPEVVTIAAETFTTEPTTEMVGLGLDYWTFLFDLMLNHIDNYASDNGLSVVAVDKETGKICGTFIGMD